MYRPNDSSASSRPGHLEKNDFKRGEGVRIMFNQEPHHVITGVIEGYIRSTHCILIRDKSNPFSDAYNKVLMISLSDVIIVNRFACEGPLYTFLNMEYYTYGRIPPSQPVPSTSETASVNVMDRASMITNFHNNMGATASAYVNAGPITSMIPMYGSGQGIYYQFSVLPNPKYAKPVPPFLKRGFVLFEELTKYFRDVCWRGYNLVVSHEVVVKPPYNVPDIYGNGESLKIVERIVNYLIWPTVIEPVEYPFNMYPGKATNSSTGPYSHEKMGQQYVQGDIEPSFDQNVESCGPLGVGDFYHQLGLRKPNGSLSARDLCWQVYIALLGQFGLREPYKERNWEDSGNRFGTEDPTGPSGQPVLRPPSEPFGYEESCVQFGHSAPSQPNEHSRSKDSFRSFSHSVPIEYYEQLGLNTPAGQLMPFVPGEPYAYLPAEVSLTESNRQMELEKQLKQLNVTESCQVKTQPCHPIHQALLNLPLRDETSALAAAAGWPLGMDSWEYELLDEPLLLRVGPSDLPTVREPSHQQASAQNPPDQSAKSHQNPPIFNLPNQNFPASKIDSKDTSTQKPPVLVQPSDDQMPSAWKMNNKWLSQKWGEPTELLKAKYSGPKPSTHYNASANPPPKSFTRSAYKKKSQARYVLVQRQSLNQPQVQDPHTDRLPALNHQPSTTVDEVIAGPSTSGEPNIALEGAGETEKEAARPAKQVSRRTKKRRVRRKRLFLFYT